MGKFELPARFSLWSREQQLEYYNSEAVQAELAKRDAAKEADPLAFYKPLPAQLAFHQSEARNRLMTGGNRAGKTEGGAAEDLFWLDGVSPYREIPKGPLVGIISGISLNLLEMSVIEKIKEYMPKARFKLKFNKATGGGWIEGRNGIAYFKSNEAGWQSYQAIALDFAHLDEEHSYEVYKQVRKRLKRGRKLNVWCTMTAEPDKPDHWTYDVLCKPAYDPKKFVDYAHFEADLEDNRISRGGYIADSEIDYVIESTPVSERPAVIHGKYTKRGGRIYPSWDRKVHVDDKERSIQSYLQDVQSGIFTPFSYLDWGARNPTAMGLILEDRDGNCHLIDEIYHPAENVLSIQREYHRKWGAFNCSYVVCDPSVYNRVEGQDPLLTIGGKLESDNYEFKVPGLPLVRGNNSIDDGLMAVRELLRIDPVKGPKLHVQPRCLEFISEIEGYVGEEWAAGAFARNKKETPRKKNDHHMDGFRYWSLSPHGHDGWTQDDRSAPMETDGAGFMKAAS